MIVTLDQSTHTYYRDGVPFDGPSVTQALAQCGLVDFSFVEEEKRQSSMARGISVHWICALHDQGALNPRRLPINLRPYRKGWMAWRQASGFIPELDWIEKSFISPLGYAGTIDRRGYFPGFSYATVDIKTGDGPIDNWIRFQLSLYCDETKTVRRVAVKLRSDGTYTTKEFPFSTFHTDRAIAIEAVRRWRKAA